MVLRNRVHQLCSHGSVGGSGEQSPVPTRKCSRLRCSSCGEVFTAAVPQEAGIEKYQATTGSIVALLKYGNGFPFYRLAQLQKIMGVPLAASVQWKLVKQKADILLSVWKVLIRMAAQGKVLHNDDTAAIILQVLKERREVLERDPSQPAQKAQTGKRSSGLEPETPPRPSGAAPYLCVRRRSAA